MKIVLPCWGLGNVMFQYAFLCDCVLEEEKLVVSYYIKNYVLNIMDMSLINCLKYILIKDLIFSKGYIYV